VIWWDYSSNNAIRGRVCNGNLTGCSPVQTIATLDATGSAAVPFACPIVAQPGGRAAPAPQLDVDHSGTASDGRVYVTWSDLKPGGGTTRCDDNSASSTASSARPSRVPPDAASHLAPIGGEGHHRGDPVVDVRQLVLAVEAEDGAQDHLERDVL
jgi:hypothetical protein